MKRGHITVDVSTTADVYVDDIMDELTDEVLIEELKKRGKLADLTPDKSLTALQVLRDVAAELHAEQDHAGHLLSCPFPLCCDAAKVLGLTGKGESLAINELFASGKLSDAG